MNAHTNFTIPWYITVWNLYNTSQEEGWQSLNFLIFKTYLSSFFQLEAPSSNGPENKNWVISVSAYKWNALIFPLKTVIEQYKEER